MQANRAVAESTAVPTVACDLRTGKYLIFQLGGEEFGVGVLKIREIMKFQEITAVPQTPSYVKGVLNLRGKVIPVIDLRMRFGLPDCEQTEQTCIVVIRAQYPEGEMPIGVVVDGVVEVLSLSAAEIEDTPDFGDGTAIPYLLGMAKVKGKVKILLDIDQIVGSQDLQQYGALVH